MTNYNERLDEILQGELVCISNDPQAYVAGIEDTKQAFTSLMKELAAEAKPEIPVATSWQGALEKKAFEDAIRVYEYKLLKALEEV